ncbi:MAG TPA: NADPH-dependent F420 reductase [Vicinamibacterales bacterium]|jgi:hypothetical protein
MTSIAILGGTGRQGSGLALRFARTGARVIVGSRDPARARDTVAGWSKPAAGSIEIADYATAAEHGDIVVLAVPFDALDALLAELALHVSTRSIVVDVTVPVAFPNGRMTMIDVVEGSASEHIRARLPPKVAMAAAFKTLPAHLLGGDGPLDCDEFVCGDTPKSRAAAAALVQRLPGVRSVDVGPLSRARLIEHSTALAIAINRTHKIHDARFRVVGLP